MSLVSELPGVVDDIAVAPANAEGVLLVDEDSGMRVQVVASDPITAIRLGNAGVGHVPRLDLHAGLNLICDYLLVVELNGHTHAILVELKTTWEPRAREQVRRSLPLLEYLRSVCEVERKAPFDGSGIHAGYLVICEKKRLNKRTMRAEPVKAADSEEYKDITVRTYIGTTISLGCGSSSSTPNRGLWGLWGFWERHSEEVSEPLEGVGGARRMLTGSTTRSAHRWACGRADAPRFVGVPARIKIATGLQRKLLNRPAPTRCQRTLFNCIRITNHADATGGGRTHASPITASASWTMMCSTTP